MLHKIITGIAALHLLGSVCAQQAVPGAADAGVGEMNTLPRAEKLFTHLDKPGYVAGETIWFKCYVTDQAGLPSAISRVAYAELLDAKGTAILQGKVELQGASGTGSFYLPFSIGTGTFRFRAYTSLMQAGGTTRFYEQDLEVINPLTLPPVELLTNNTDSGYSLQFFPEGGSLVEGLDSRLGVKLTDATGMGKAFTGVIIDERSDTLARFSSLRYGLGNTSFRPEAGHRYRGIVTAGSARAEAALPQAEPDGLVIRLSEDVSSFRLTLTASANYSNQAFYLLAGYRQSLKSARILQLQGTTGSLTVDKSSLGEGLNRLTLLNSDRLPVAERLCFIPPARGASINAAVAAPVIGQREGGAVRVNVKDAFGASSMADLSIGIYRVDALQPQGYRSIGSYLWLGSGLAGGVEDIDYYFGTTPEVKAALDNLLLTHGWTSFSKARSASVQSFRYLPEQEGMLIRGKILDRTTSAPVAGTPVYVAPVGGNNVLGLGRTAADGSFTVALRGYYGESRLVVQAPQQPDAQISLIDPFSEQRSSIPVYAHPLNESDRQALLDAGIGSQAQNIFREAELQRATAPYNRDSTSFYGKPDGKYFLDKFTRFSTMEEVMREYVQAVNIRKIGGKWRLRVNNQPRDKLFQADPLMLVDGVPVFDADRIGNYDPLKVYKIEVINRQYLLNGEDIPGIVSFTTYQNDLPEFELDPHALLVDYAGLQLRREFYTPSYKSAAEKQSRIPDLRNQLLWKGDLRIPASGELSIPFTSSDVPGIFIGVVQGITSMGAPASTSFTFQVK